MFITSRHLKLKKACIEQVKLFEQLYPDGVEITEKGCVEVFDKFDWNWAAENLLSEYLLQEYNCVTESARQEYNRATKPALQEYNRVTESALKEYDRVTESARQEYILATKTALKEYILATKPALKEYDRVRAKTFGRLASQM